MRMPELINSLKVWWCIDTFNFSSFIKWTIKSLDVTGWIAKVKICLNKFYFLISKIFKLKFPTFASMRWTWIVFSKKITQTFTFICSLFRWPTICGTWRTLHFVTGQVFVKATWTCFKMKKNAYLFIFTIKIMCIVVLRRHLSWSNSYPGIHMQRSAKFWSVINHSPFFLFEKKMN